MREIMKPCLQVDSEFGGINSVISVGVKMKTSLSIK